MPRHKRRWAKSKSAGSADGAAKAPPADTANVRAVLAEDKAAETVKGAGAVVQRRQGTVDLQEQEPQGQTIRLRNGTQMDAVDAGLWWELLDHRWKSPAERSQFDALAAVALGKASSIPDAMISDLRYLLTADGSSIKPDVKKVLLACYEETPSGPKWHQLVDEKNIKDKLVLEVLQEEANQRLRGLIKDLGGGASGKGRGRMLAQA